MTASPLDEVPGIGPSRKRALLMHFGTAKAVRGAALEDLEKAPGISRTMARGIYDYFHPVGLTPLPAKGGAGVGQAKRSETL